MPPALVSRLGTSVSRMASICTCGIWWKAFSFCARPLKDATEDEDAEDDICGVVSMAEVESAEEAAPLAANGSVFPVRCCSAWTFDRNSCRCLYWAASLL